MKDIEKRTVYISLFEAQSLYDLYGSSSEISISLEKIGQEAEVITQLKPYINGLEIGSWQTNFPENDSSAGNEELCDGHL